MEQAVSTAAANQPMPVSDTLGSKSMTSVPALVLGIISVMLGALAFLCCWIPFVGILVIPFTVIGVALGVVGLVIGLIKRRKAFGMPITGIVLCVISAVIPILITGALMSYHPDTTAENLLEKAPEEEWSFEGIKPEPINEVKSPMRTWTNREGRELEAELIRLFKMDGVFHGEFVRPSGDVFTYKIGNFSQADIQFVKDLQEKSTN